MKTQLTRFVLAVAIMIYAQLSSAQAGYNQVLSKYSYPIFTVVGGQQRTGTAFFYKSGDTTYLVSNYHAIKGMNPLKKVINFTTDTLYLKYPVKNSHDVRVVPIDISDGATGTTEI